MLTERGKDAPERMEVNVSSAGTGWWRLEKLHWTWEHLFTSSTGGTRSLGDWQMTGAGDWARPFCATVPVSIKRHSVALLLSAKWSEGRKRAAVPQATLEHESGRVL